MNKKTIFLNGQKYIVIHKIDNEDLQSIDKIRDIEERFNISLTLKLVFEYFNLKKDLFIGEYKNIVFHELKPKTEIIEDLSEIEVISIVGGG